MTLTEGLALALCAGALFVLWDSVRRYFALKSRQADATDALGKEIGPLLTFLKAREERNDKVLKEFVAQGQAVVANLYNHAQKQSVDVVSKVQSMNRAGIRR